MSTLHVWLGWTMIGWNGAVGLWGVLAAWRKREVGPFFALGTIAGLVLAVIQVLLGVGLLVAGINPGSFHIFYGMTVVFLVGFAYIYRVQLAVHPGLRWGLLLLFMAGLGLRGWQTFGMTL